MRNDTPVRPVLAGWALSGTTNGRRAGDQGDLQDARPRAEVGEVLLSSGAGAADVTATMLSLAHGLGLRGIDVDVTFTALQMSYQESFDDPALIQVRNVRHRDIDYEDLTQVDILIQDVLSGEIDRDEHAAGWPRSSRRDTGCPAGRSRWAGASPGPASVSSSAVT